MTSRPMWRRYLRFLGNDHNADVEEELRFHLEMRAQELMAGGLEPEAARDEAARLFGDAERVEEECRRIGKEGERRMRRSEYFEGLVQDFRHAVRRLLKTPGFTAVAVLTLALGIGATTAIFSVVKGVLLRPLPYPAHDRIVQLWQLGDEGDRGSWSYPNFLDLQTESGSFAALAEYRPGIVTVTGAGEAARATVGQIQGDFFPTLGIQAFRGRTFLPEEGWTAAPVVMVSHAYWQQNLGGDVDVIGRQIVLDDRGYTIVGVTPPGFSFPTEAELWMPQQVPTDPSRTAHGGYVIGRLADGVSMEQARQELSALALRLKERYGDETWMSSTAVVPLHEQLVGDVRQELLTLLSATALLLIIACINVVNLLLVRGASRRQELAVRMALGAGRQRAMQPFLSEALVLAVTGGVMGVLLAIWAVDALLAFQPSHVPRLEDVRVDWVVMAFAAGIAVFAAGVLGGVAGLRATSETMRGVLTASHRTQTGGLASHRLRGGLAAAQIALTLVLLLGAALLGRSFLQLRALDPGYRTEGAVVMDIPLPETVAGAVDDPFLLGSRNTRAALLLDELLTRLHALPGVTEAGAVSAFPLSGDATDGMFLTVRYPDEVTNLEDWQRLAGIPERTGYADYRIATEGYFDAMDIPLLRGRLFTERDDPNAPNVAVVSEALAERQWPGEDPIGKLIQFGNMDGNLRPFTIIGVVGDVRHHSLEAEPVPTFYGLARQRTTGLGGTINIVMASAGDPTAVIASARGIAQTLAPDAPLRFRTLEEIFASALDDRRFSLFLLGTFAAAALLLAALGIYGVVAYAVAQRTKEIGIRMAVGAGHASVLRLVLRQGMTLIAAGLAVGLLTSLAITRLLSGFLYNVSSTDPLTFAVVAILLAYVALMAIWLPARRATRVDPMVALRAE